MSLAIGLQSMLFVPGSKPERFAKALASGADCVCIDLEDAVPPEGKVAARDAAFAAIAADTTGRLTLRINALTTPEGAADIAALAAAKLTPPLLFVPKVEGANELGQARTVLGIGQYAFVPLIETVKGLREIDQIAASSRVKALMFGGADFAAEIGAELSWEPLYAARAALVMAGALAGIPVIDVPSINLDDPDGLTLETQRIKAMGFAAKAAIHPAQIATIHAVMRPTPAQIAEAEAAETAFAAANGAAVRFNGKMLEAPIMRRYRQILMLKDKIHA